MRSRFSILSKQLIACFIFLNLILPVGAEMSVGAEMGFTMTDDHFKVFPNKEYTGKVCFTGPESVKPILTNTSGLIKSYSISEKFTPMNLREFRCGTYTFSINEVKNVDEAIIIEKLVLRNIMSGTDELGTYSVGHKVTIDATEISYQNVLLKLSGKLVVTILSFFAVLSLLLYIIRKIHKE